MRDSCYLSKVVYRNGIAWLYKLEFFFECVPLSLEAFIIRKFALRTIEILAAYVCRGSLTGALLGQFTHSTERKKLASLPLVLFLCLSSQLCQLQCCHRLEQNCRISYIFVRYTGLADPEIAGVSVSIWRALDFLFLQKNTGFDIVRYTK